jgi:hypothetical protein
MQGAGRIFELYASGEVEGDDEVALTFHPETLEPLSEPLVNMRLNLRNAVEKGLIDDTEASSILHQVALSYFPKRSIELMMQVIGERLDEATGRPLCEFLRKNYTDYKRADAVSVIKALRAARGEIDAR